MIVTNLQHRSSHSRDYTQGGRTPVENELRRSVSQAKRSIQRVHRVERVYGIIDPSSWDPTGSQLGRRRFPGPFGGHNRFGAADPVI